MTKLLAEIVSDIVAHNPSAPSEVIVSGILSSMEEEILPAVLKRIRIPEFPSPAGIKLQEFREKRRKKKYKDYSVKELLALWQQVEYVKYQLNGQKSDCSSLYERIETGSSTFDLPQVTRSLTSTFEKSIVMRKDGVPVPEDRLRGQLEKPSRFESILPYPHLKLKEEKRVPKFALSEELRNNVISDPFWRDFIAAIEVNLRKLASSYSSTIDFNMYVRKDVEIPSWRKTILGIDAPEMDFERKMVLWDIIDSRVRQTIQERMKRLSEVEKETLKRLNRNIFTKMEFS